ncbi:MAG: 4Fe-4S dicluster domain-containing protein [Clostridia bacterium]|nr:4Fe-4S dicluster domain-containing protein [Clostridia bacterium]
MASMNRRDFIKRTAAAAAITTTAVTGVAAGPVYAGNSKGQYATVIDMTRCDGCKEFDTPKCVTACKVKNGHRYPEPIDNIPDYWPQKKHEDWSGKRDITNRLTPYNWIFVQNIQVEDKGKTYELSIPRRCMHCDNPPCAKMCPFGVMEKTREGAVTIDHNFCMGGSKCKDVCSWGIPQRQAGVGMYLKLAPKLAGGGVMYKCDLCQDLISKGEKPACAAGCPNNAMTFGLRDEVLQYAEDLAQKMGGFIYGDKENGGTSTYYVSPVSFEVIDSKLKEEQNALRMHGAENPLEKLNGMGKAMLIAPIAGIFAAAIASYKTMKGER